MKQLLVVRHAKSSWEDFTVADFDRPLNDRGKRDAPMMADRIASRSITPDVIITSPAKRARRTAEIFAAELKMPPENILEENSLYEASVEEFYAAVGTAPVSAQTIMLFSHNPGITAFVNSLTPTNVDEMPTCAVFAVQADISDWAQFREAKKEFLFFDYPRK